VKPVRWTAHAEQARDERGIPLEVAERVLRSPESVEERGSGRKVIMGRFSDPILAKEMLLRIIVDETAAEVAVVTIYKTSQVSKYLAGGDQ
jgi:hypothetical protein